MRIAVLGRKGDIKRLQHYTKDNQQIDIIPLIYHQPSEIVDVINHVYHCDVYLFTEAYAYLYTKEKLPKHLPVVTVPYDEYMVLTSFFQLLRETKRPLGRLSIDVVDKQHVSKVLTDLRMETSEVYTIDYQAKTTVETIVNYHVDLWEKNKIDYVLTTIEEVAEHLTKQQIPHKRIQAPIVNIKQALDKCVAMIQFNQDKHAQVVACYVRMRPVNNVQDMQQPCENLQKVLDAFSKKTNASVVRYQENQFALFGTNEMLTYVTDNYRHFPLLERIKEVVAIPVDIGFGLGLHAKQAEMHAKLALDVCKKSPQTSCYLINDSKEIIGPIGVKRHVDPAKLYQALIHRARLNNETSYHFIDFITSRNNEPFSSHDVADYYRVTKRSAERTINKLLGGKVIKIVGEEKPYTRGRPRKLYKVE